MQTHTYESMSVKELQQLIERESPDNEDQRHGYALVNVLAPEAFAAEHIPQSINIPADDIDTFEQQYAKDKQIIVYCASLDCQASPKAAQQLAERGFTRVYDFEEGLKGWKDAGHAVRGEKASMDEVS